LPDGVRIQGGPIGSFLRSPEVHQERSAYDGGRISLAAQRDISNLDAKLREQMRVEVKRLQRRLNIVILFVTHDQVGALSLSNRSEWGS